MHAVSQALRLGRIRALAQDPSFGIRQIVDIALRALSPSLNDPTTACACAERLGELLRPAASAPDPSSFRGRDGRLRLVVRATDFGALMDAAFHQIRRSGSSHVTVLEALLAALETVAETACRDHAGVLQRHLDLIGDVIAEGTWDRSARQSLEERHRSVTAVCARTAQAF